jgi:LysR family transcriptional regulator, glycine cleavage system transcriptional activator
MANPPRRLPNLSALRAFEAAARHGSFTAAAAELFVTHSAISHQIRALEEELGATLFQRSGRRIALTEIGAAYANQITAAFANIALATASIVRDHRTPRLVLSTIPSFAARWLAPRLGRFIIDNPEVDLELRSSTDLVDLEHSDVDVGIRFGTGPYPDLFCEPLMHETFLVACSPKFNGGVFPETPADLPDFTLLRSDYERWRLWFDAAGLPHAQTPTRGAIYEDSSLLIEGAAEGLGIAMVRASLAADAIASGRLVQLFPEIVAPSPWSYWVVSSKANAERLPVKRFREWVVAEARGFLDAQPDTTTPTMPFVPETASVGGAIPPSPRGLGRTTSGALKSFPPLSAPQTQTEAFPCPDAHARGQSRSRKSKQAPK